MLHKMWNENHASYHHYNTVNVTLCNSFVWEGLYRPTVLMTMGHRQCSITWTCSSPLGWKGSIVNYKHPCLLVFQHIFGPDEKVDDGRGRQGYDNNTADVVEEGVYYIILYLCQHFTYLLNCKIVSATLAYTSLWLLITLPTFLSSYPTN